MKRVINRLIIHCSATRPSLDVGTADIRGWHKMRGFSDIGYHYVIRRSGEVERGRSEGQTGAHVRGHNRDSLGICLIGGVDDGGRPDANYTGAQYRALKDVLTDCLRRYPEAEILGHRDLAAKACPCFDVGSWWERVR